MGVESISIKLDHSFFMPEERSGFYVSEQRKKIWAVELDLLHEFFSVCENYDIEAYAFAGTLLGAIRHKGFIPWDYDADVCMTRKNYEKLVAIANEVFKPPYFFQTARSDRCFFTSAARLRNSETTGIIAWNYSPEYNNGIYMDCFVMDAVPQSKALFKMQQKELYFLQSLAKCYKPNTVIDVKNEIGKHRFIKSIIKDIVSYETILDFYDKISQHYNGKSNELALVSTAVFSEKYRCMEEELSGYNMTSFENIEIPIPLNADRILKYIYGDYMTLPQIENQEGSTNEAIIVDPDRNYKQYFEEKSNENMVWNSTINKLIPF